MIDARLIVVERGDRAEAEAVLREAAPDLPADQGWDGPTVYVDQMGNPIAAVGRYRGDMGALRQAFRAYPMSTTKRTAGIRNVSAVFGYVSRRVHMKREGCRACGGAGEAPGAHQAIMDAGQWLTAELGDLCPDVYAADQRTAEPIHPEWRIPGTHWTSGVLNDTSPLPYHYDRNNLPTWSAMIVARRDVEGGHLHIPELNLTIPCRDRDVVYFPGWNYVHGVTPMRRTRPDGYRYTAVFYTVAGMQTCLPPAEETARARQHRSHREDTLLARQAENGLRADTPEPVPGRAATSEVTDLTPGLDFRLPEYRRETFLRFYEFHLKHRTHPGCVYFLMPYLREKYGWDQEEALWFAFINGNTQHPVTSLELHRRFPTPGHADDMMAWWETNHRRLPVDTDRQRPKQSIREAVPFYVAEVRGDQAGHWETKAEMGFAAVWEAARTIPGFGRLSAFSYAEYLLVMGVPGKAPTRYPCSGGTAERMSGQVVPNRRRLVRGLDRGRPGPPMAEQPPRSAVAPSVPRPVHAWSGPRRTAGRPACNASRHKQPTVRLPRIRVLEAQHHVRCNARARYAARAAARAFGMSSMAT